MYKNQTGFRPGLGIENALYDVTKFIYDELDNSNKVLTVLQKN